MIKISYLPLLALFIIACSSGNKHIKTEHLPDEWAYMQRAYPHDKINAESVKKATAQVQEYLDNNNLKNNNEWISEGPTNIGGRISGIARHPTDPNTFYIAAAVGGVFKTINGGDTWTSIFDDLIFRSIGAIAVSKSNPDVIYVGTGEANGSATSGAYFGTGIYRSDDAGATWTHVGLENSNHIAKIQIDENDPNTLWVAASGILYGRNNERGFYKSTDGGINWQQLLFTGDNHACTDFVIDPMNNNNIYVAMWERERRAWIRDYGGPGSAIHKTNDGGQTWVITDVGLPMDNSERGRIGLAISKFNPNVIYASLTTNQITNALDGIYKSTDGADTWEEVAEGLPGFAFGSFGWYFGNIRLNPFNDNELYVLGVQLWNAKDAINDEFEPVDPAGMHVDFHALEFFDVNPNDILYGNDGGLYRSLNGGDTIRHINNLPITQFYNIEVDPQIPERLFGGTQDNNTIVTYDGAPDDYSRILGGDGFHVNVDPRNSDLIYAEFQFGGLHKSTDGGLNFDEALEGIDEADRSNWNTPVVMSPFNPSVLYFGTQRLYTSIEAINWVPISEDLSNGLHPTGVLSFGTLTTIAPSYNNLETIYIGTDDGNVWVTTDGGLNWNSIKEGIPERYVTRIAINPFNDAEAIVTLSGYQYLDYEPHVMITQDFGNSWTDISSNLPAVPVNDIVYNPELDNQIYIGTDLGMWYSTDKGLNWEMLGKGLPPTVIKDVEIDWPSRKLYAGTFGRSIYALDLEDIDVAIDEQIAFSAGVYPNPAASHDDIIVSSEMSNSTVTIFTLDGKYVHRMELNGQKQSIGKMDKGVYLIKFENEGKLLTEKLIIH